MGWIELIWHLRNLNTGRKTTFPLYRKVEFESSFRSKSLLKAAYIKTTGDACFNWGVLKFLLLKFQLVLK